MLVRSSPALLAGHRVWAAGREQTRMKISVDIWLLQMSIPSLSFLSLPSEATALLRPAQKGDGMRAFVLRVASAFVLSLVLNVCASPDANAQSCPTGSCAASGAWCWNICQIVVHEDLPPFPGTCEGEDGACQPITCYTFIENEIPPEAFAARAVRQQYARVGYTQTTPEWLVGAVAQRAVVGVNIKGATMSRRPAQRPWMVPKNGGGGAVTLACSNPHFCDQNSMIRCVT